jgi:hypothetical protein
MNFDKLGDPEKIFWLQSAVLETAAVPMLLSSAISDRHVCVIRALFARLRPQATWVGATQVIVAGSLNDLALDYIGDCRRRGRRSSCRAAGTGPARREGEGVGQAGAGNRGGRAAPCAHVVDVKTHS